MSKVSAHEAEILSPVLGFKPDPLVAGNARARFIYAVPAYLITFSFVCSDLDVCSVRFHALSILKSAPWVRKLQIHRP